MKKNTKQIRTKECGLITTAVYEGAEAEFSFVWWDVEGIIKSNPQVNNAHQ